MNRVYTPGHQHYIVIYKRRLIYCSIVQNRRGMMRHLTLKLIRVCHPNIIRLSLSETQRISHYCTFKRSTTLPFDDFRYGGYGKLIKLFKINYKSIYVNFKLQHSKQFEKQYFLFAQISIIFISVRQILCYYIIGSMIYRVMLVLYSLVNVNMIILLFPIIVVDHEMLYTFFVVHGNIIAA